MNYSAFQKWLFIMHSAAIRAAFSLALFVIFATIIAKLEPAMQAIADDCTSENWKKINNAMFHRIGCIRQGGKLVHFSSVAFDLSKNKLSLSGSAKDGRVPRLEDITDNPVLAKQFTLDHFVSNSTSIPLAVSVGYPISPEVFAPEGLVRIDSKDYSQRDTTFAFKSALLCLNETNRENPDKGSRVLVFNAFENGVPVQLNSRVVNKKNCPDVVQVGPRVVEYRAKKGITKRAQNDKAQKYLIFSQGNGPKFYGYITILIDPSDLYSVQELLLTPSRFSPYDKKMRVAVTLTTERHSAMSVRDGEKIHKTYGKINSPHPVFLTVTPE